MDQRNIQGQKQASGMTQEELQRTQVLNLQDVEEAARIEKITSKKPAIIVATIGVFSILFGTAFPVVQTLATKPVSNEKKTVKVEKKRIVNPETNLNCTYTNLNKPDGTDTILNAVFTFNYDKLIKVEKTFTINPTVGNPLGPTTVQAYITGYRPFLAEQIAGYQMSATPTGDGLIVKSLVDLTVFNPTTLPTLHQGNVATKVEYEVNTDRETIYKDLTAKEFTCQ